MGRLALMMVLGFRGTVDAQGGTPITIANGLPNLPFLTVSHVSTASPLTPGGFKGVGEGGTIAPGRDRQCRGRRMGPSGAMLTSLPILPEPLLTPKRSDAAGQLIVSCGPLSTGQCRAARPAPGVGAAAGKYSATGISITVGPFAASACLTASPISSGCCT
jgi:hypothetical protein